MMSQLFEVQIKEGHTNRYMDLAAALKPALTARGGCLFTDRFKSLTRANLLLSSQVWQDEGSMTAWRVDASHHKVQEIGREKIFSDYRIRIAQVILEARPGKPNWQPRRCPTYAIATELKNAELPVTTQWRRDSFETMYRHGYFAHLVDLPDYQSGLEFGARLFADPTTEYFRIFEVIRDYGMYDRLRRHSTMPLRIDHRFKPLERLQPRLVRVS